MKIIHSAFNLLFLFSILFIACSQPSKPTPSSSSYELINRDTVNKLDGMGKQGIWVPTRENKLKDTVYYRNDSIILNE